MEKQVDARLSSLWRMVQKVLKLSLAFAWVMLIKELWSVLEFTAVLLAQLLPYYFLLFCACPWGILILTHFNGFCSVWPVTKLAENEVNLLTFFLLWVRYNFIEGEDIPRAILAGQLLEMNWMVTKRVGRSGQLDFTNCKTPKTHYTERYVVLCSWEKSWSWNRSMKCISLVSQGFNMKLAQGTILTGNLQ